MSTTKIFSDGRFYQVAMTPEVVRVLNNCVRWDGVYVVVRASERETVLKNRVETQ